MKRTLTIALVCALSGCGASQAATRTAAEADHEREVAEERDAEALEAQRQRVRELEAQLGLARAETVQLRDELAVVREDQRRRVTRIASAPVEEVVEEEEAPPPPADEGPRPVLRLYGTSPRPSANAQGVVAMGGPLPPNVVAPPPVASIRLPVSADANNPEIGVPQIPLTPITVAQTAGAQNIATLSPTAEPPAPRGPVSPMADPIVQEYRAALAHLSERRLDDALRGLDRFLERHPSHPYADNALYWRGEIQYTQRSYEGALTTFSSLIEQYPRGNKVPDALLRIGLCYQRLGQRSRAQRVFDRLRMQYPESVAARTAPQEDA